MNTRTPAQPADRKALWSWALFDFGNSGFTTVVSTFVFSAYFTQAIAPDAETGTALWGTATGIAGLIIALTSPVAGAIADHTGRRKPWLAFFTLLCIVATAALWFAAPGPNSIPLALTVAVFGTVGFEVGLVFYNTMLPDLTTPTRLGRVSGLAWGLGYAGGLICLVVALVGFVQADPSPFGFDKGNAEHVRATMLVTAGWIALFTWPLFAFTPDNPRTGLALSAAIQQGLSTLIGTLRNARQHANSFRFLIARMIYIDGVNTMFAFGGIYAAGTFGMTLEDIIVFGIALNVTAGLGAAVFGWVDDRFGSKRTLTVSLVALTVSAVGVLIAQTVPQFWVTALIMSTFFGPVQAASRTFMARLAPPEIRGEMFGLFAVSGKVTSFVGPFAVGAVTILAGSQRIGMATILVFLIAGLLLLQTVKEPGR
ncbi:MAG: MFS transporter [Alphaproteobacteria bacterium]|nr:MFS transporter [Alphaproteobacteria bacterium]